MLRFVSYRAANLHQRSFASRATPNITKSGSISWMPGYNSATNQYTTPSNCSTTGGVPCYDANGNLFIDGRTTHGVFALMELFEGAKQLNLLKVSGGTIYFPGMVQWNASAQDLIVGDQSCRNAYASRLYTLTIGSGSAKIAATISLKNSSGGTVCDLVQGYVYDGKLFGSDFDFCGSLASATYAWSYPAGGAPTLSNATADTAPIGATVSP